MRALVKSRSVPAVNVYVLQPGMPDEIGSCLDPLGNAVHSALSFELAGEDVLITGAGPIGVMSTAVSKMVGARYIVVTDSNAYRLNLARRMGATLAVDYRTTSLDQVMKELGMLEGFDIGLELCGDRCLDRCRLRRLRDPAIDVADRRHGADRPGSVPVRLQLAAQVTHVRAQCVRVRALAAPHVRIEAARRHDVAGVRDEQIQDPELGRR